MSMVFCCRVLRSKKLLVPEPVHPRTEPLRITDRRFGRVPRVYIECLLDNAIRPSPGCTLSLTAASIGLSDYRTVAPIVPNELICSRL
jgi:hypothetical protein